MSYKILAIFMIIAAMMFLMIGCSDEKENSPTQTTGICMNCHGDNGDLQENVMAIKAQWAHSIHASGNNIDRNGASCAGCHDSQGFIARIAGDSAMTITNPSPIHCFTCHAPHTNFNFNLRINSPVDLRMGGIFNMGNGNLCAQCHQARVPSPLIPATDTIRITSSRWGPHHATMANTLSGQGAYVINTDGSVYLDTLSSDGYAAGSNSFHTTGVTNGCPTCHMATPFGDVAGGHTMALTYEAEGAEDDLVTGCNQTGCHTAPALTDFNHNGAQDDVLSLLTTLKTTLTAQGLLDTTDLAVPGTRTVAQAAALYNYLFIEADLSNGVHNHQYSHDVLQASIDALAAREL